MIVPTHSRPERLRECLESIASQNHSCQVIVVNDGGTGDLEAVLEPFRPRLQLTLLHQEQAGPARARNYGASLAQARNLVFLDDDCRMGENWLRVAEARLGTHPQSAVGGQLVNAFPDNLWAQASQLMVDYLYERLNADPQKAEFLGSGHLAVSAEGFRSLGGFSARYPRAAAEDRDFCERWRRSGRDLIYACEMRTYHAHALTARSFFRQHFAYGRGACSFHRERSRGLEPGSFYLGLLSYPWRRTRGQRTPLLGLLVLLSQLIHATGYLWEWAQNR